MGWKRDVVIFIIALFAFEAYRLGPSQAHLGVIRRAALLAFKGTALVTPFVSSRTLAPDASSRVELLRALLRKLYKYPIHPVCDATGRFSKEEIAETRDYGRKALSGRHIIVGICPEYALQEAHNFPAGSFWVDARGFEQKDDDDDDSPLIVHFHGGGAVFNTAIGDTGFGFKLSQRLGFRILHLAFPLAPETPSAKRGAIVAALLRQAHALNPRRQLILSGLSGGGYPLLEALFDMQANGEAKKLVQSVIMHSPMVAGRLDLPSHTENVANDLFSSSTARCVIDANFGTQTSNVTLLDRTDWSGFPPMLFQASEMEILRDDSVEAVKRIKASHGEAELYMSSYTPHVPAFFSDWCPESHAALTHVVEWVKEHRT